MLSFETKIFFLTNWFFGYILIFYTSTELSSLIHYSAPAKNSLNWPLFQFTAEARALLQHLKGSKKLKISFFLAVFVFLVEKSCSILFSFEAWLWGMVIEPSLQKKRMRRQSGRGKEKWKWKWKMSDIRLAHRHRSDQSKLVCTECWLFGGFVL